MSERYAGRFALIRPLGEGGMGEVHLARDLDTGAECALKRLPHAAGAALAERLRAEFAVLSRLRHPAVVEVRELGFAPDGQPFLVMEFVPGLSADRALGAGDWPALVHAMARVVDGLEALHAAGIVHGDVKPQNVIVMPPSDLATAGLRTDVRLVDFGLSSVPSEAPRAGGGTAGFAAPEVAAGGVPTPAADLYGLGATMLAIGTGAETARRTPATARGPAAIPAPREELERAGAPPRLVRLVMALLAKNPAERPASARDVRAELAALQPDAVRPLADRLDADVFVGRPREEARIEAARRAAFDGTRALLIEGPAGIGKTSLLARAAARATIEGHPVLRVTRPLGPEPGAAGDALLRRIAAEALHGVPHAAEARAPEPRSSEPERLAAAARDLAAIAERRGPALIVVDDADELDGRTFSLLTRLLLHASCPPVLWLWTRRAGGSGVLDLAVDAGAVERLVLGPLDAAAAERLVAARISATPPPRLGLLLHERTQGHPGLLVESLRVAARAGAVADSEGGVVAMLDRLAQLPLPDDFERAKRAGFAALSAGARRALLQLAACDGRAAESDLAAMGTPLDAGARREWISSRLAVADASGVWRLSPQSLGASLLQEATPDERREAVERALARPALGDAVRFGLLVSLDRTDEALAAAERAHATDPSEALALRAAEYAAVHAADRSAEWWLRAADFARRAARYAAASERYARALAATSAGDPDARGRAWEGLTVALLREGRLDEVDRAFTDALAEPLAPAIRPQLLAGWTAVASQRGDVAELERRVAAVAPEVEASADPVARALLALSRAYAERARGRPEGVRAALEDAWQHAARSADRQLAMRVRVAAMIARDSHSAADIEAVDALVSEYRTRGHRLGLHEGLMALLVERVRAGEWQQAMATAEELLRNALEDGRRGDAADALAAAALLDALMGNPNRGRGRARAARRAAGATTRRMRVLRLRVGARAARAQGALAHSERLARLAVREALADGAPEERTWARVELTATLSARGHWSRAAELAREVTREAQIEHLGDAMLHAYAARGVLRNGEAAEAEGRLGRIEAWLARQPSLLAAAHAEVLRAELALARADGDAAGEAARRAVLLFEALPCPADRGLALLDLAEFALEREARRAPVHEWLARALEVFDRFQDDGHRVRALRATLQARALDTAGSSGGLTDRDLIVSFTGLLGSLSEPAQLAHRALELAGRRFDAERGVLVLRDAETDELHTLAEYGSVDATARHHALGYSTRIVREVAHSGSSQIVFDATGAGSTPSVSQLDLGLRSILCVPLVVHGSVSGALYMDHSRRAEVFSDADRGLLEAFANLVGLALERSRGQVEVEREYRRLMSENRELSQTLTDRALSDELIVGTHPKVQRMLGEIHRAARTPRLSVLVTGETGTGKDLVAVRLHGLSNRAKRTFMPLHCGVIPRDLLAARLFGYKRGAFSGADRDEVGVFVRANGGTVFLDEIGEMPLEQQVALLRVLQSGEVLPLGSSVPVHVDVRVVAATNQDLAQLVQERRFREDLYYRLDVIHIHVPPLRERKTDIPALVEHFVQSIAREWNRPAPRLSRELLATVMRSNWPGNVRELKHYIERLFANTTGDAMYPDSLPNDLAGPREAPTPTGTGRLNEEIESVERRLILEALETAEGNQSQAARLLGIPEPSLRYRLKKYASELSRENLRARQKFRIDPKRLSK